MNLRLRSPSRISVPSGLTSPQNSLLPLSHFTHNLSLSAVCLNHHFCLLCIVRRHSRLPAVHLEYPICLSSLGCTQCSRVVCQSERDTVASHWPSGLPPDMSDHGLSESNSPASVASLEEEDDGTDYTGNGLRLDSSPFGLEKIWDYEPGRHHPVHLGDQFGKGGPYRVIHKLGNGGFRQCLALPRSQI